MAAVIREATVEDAPLLLGLMQRAFATVYDRFGITPETWTWHAGNLDESSVAECFAKGWRFFVADAAGEAIGCAALAPSREGEGVLSLNRLCVLPAHRGRGLGRHLVDHVLAEARRAGAHRLRLGMLAPDVELQAWYERLGFAFQETRHVDGVPCPLTVLARDL